MDSPNDNLESPDSPLCASYNPSLPLDLIKDEEIKKIKGDAIGNKNGKKIFSSRLIIFKMCCSR